MNSNNYYIHTFNRAQENDYTIVNELLQLLETPYDEHSESDTRQWYRKTPSWANSKLHSENIFKTDIFITFCFLFLHYCICVFNGHVLAYIFVS
jgi:hypothetical protein